MQYHVVVDHVFFYVIHSQVRYNDIGTWHFIWRNVSWSINKPDNNSDRSRIYVFIQYMVRIWP